MRPGQTNPCMGSSQRLRRAPCAMRTGLAMKWCGGAAPHGVRNINNPTPRPPAAAPRRVQQERFMCSPRRRQRPATARLKPIAGARRAAPSRGVGATERVVGVAGGLARHRRGALHLQVCRRPRRRGGRRGGRWRWCRRWPVTAARAAGRRTRGAIPCRTAAAAARRPRRGRRQRCGRRRLRRPPGGGRARGQRPRVGGCAALLLAGRPRRKGARLEAV
jgi:hypothetical protein